MTDAYDRFNRDLGDENDYRPVTIKIVYNPAPGGGLRLEGNVYDIPLACRLLDEAKDAIIRQKTIIPATDSDMEQLIRKQ